MEAQGSLKSRGEAPTAPGNGQSDVLVRRMPVGAEVHAAVVHFRVWAPQARQVSVVMLDDAQAEETPLRAEGLGYFSGESRRAQVGGLYQFRLDQGHQYPDPASRFQPQGPHGPSQVVDPAQFPWTDHAWKGVSSEGQVIYEMHVGTFTSEGTWAAAARELGELARTGITLLEVMPVADFPGRFGWGYDGVNLFAPTRLYGGPDDFRRFVDQAHAAGLGVILDVVYNHLGPDGNYLKAFSPDYFTDRHSNEWGEALNFDGPNSEPVREFFLANAAHWIDEYHLDGLRLDATQQIFDSSNDHILAALGRRVRQAARGRSTFVVAENERQEARLVRPAEQGGYGLDAMWNDDFHHSARVALTGKNPAYYSDHLGTPQEFISALKWGFLYQGQHYSWQKKPRGHASLDLPPHRLVAFLENHDQVANSADGRRCRWLTHPGRYRALTALLLLGPQTPMLFQGQEFGSSKPFLFFADHKPELAQLVAQGRRKFLSQFPNLSAETDVTLLDPADPATFERCRLDFAERERHPDIYALHRDLLTLRRQDPVFGRPRHRGLDGAVLGSEAFVIRFFAPEPQEDRLLLVNLGRELHLRPAPEPLLAPPESCSWRELWSSDEPRYGGAGSTPVDTGENWRVPGEAAVVLTSVREPLPAART